VPDDITKWPIGRLLSTASRQVENRWQEALAAHGLTHAGVIVLHFLSEVPRSQTELAVLAKVGNQTMSRTIDRLERAGHVTRQRDPGDGRRQLVSITDAGSSVFRVTRTIEGDLFPDVGEQEILRAKLVQIIRAHENRG
jgi:DNA-binding MarR family transcriptional regulator